MTETPLEAWADALEARFGGDRPVRVYRATGSTQDVARVMTTSEPSPGMGAVVVADGQTAGRGRQGKAWHSPPGKGLALSVAVASVRASDRLSLAVGVTLAEALDRWLVPAGRSTGIKWPNDLVVDGRKLGGVLVEAAEGFAVVGVGLNVGVASDDLPDGLRDAATSLSICGASADRLDVLLDAVAAIDRAAAGIDDDALRAAWSRRCETLGRDVRLTCDGEVVAGRVMEIDPDAGLVVRRPDGEVVRLRAATTSVIETAGN
ncbi:MAG: biotin--[acetyl-CoA-carboxylase] ligase [Planctomycetota bacterium]